MLSPFSQTTIDVYETLHLTLGLNGMYSVVAASVWGGVRKFSYS